MVCTYREMRIAVKREKHDVRQVIRCKGGLRIQAVRPDGRPMTYHIKPEGLR